METNLLLIATSVVVCKGDLSKFGELGDLLAKIFRMGLEQFLGNKAIAFTRSAMVKLRLNLCLYFFFTSNDNRSLTYDARLCEWWILFSQVPRGFMHV